MKIFMSAENHQTEEKCDYLTKISKNVFSNFFKFRSIKRCGAWRNAIYSKMRKIEQEIKKIFMNAENHQTKEKYDYLTKISKKKIFTFFKFRFVKLFGA